MNMPRSACWEAPYCTALVKIYLQCACISGLELILLVTGDDGVAGGGGECLSAQST